MSYNISDWQTIELDHLVIPIELFDESDLTWKRRSKLSVQLAESGGIEGHTEENENLIIVDSIEVRGEGSGRNYEDILKPALAKSTGTLEAFLVWEEGDKMIVLSVKDGAVNEENFNPVEVLKELRALRKAASDEGATHEG